MADGAHKASDRASSEPVGIAQQASGPASSDRGKLRVFVSYSRNDLEFADQLDAALKACGFESFIDRHGISGGEDWKRRLGNLISEADTVVFVLSSSSARSAICDWEVEEAARLNKRILPLVFRPLEGVNPPPRLQDLNYIFFYKEPKMPDSGFGTGLANLVTALNTDFDWLREHTRYLQRAIEWEKGGRGGQQGGGGQKPGQQQQAEVDKKRKRWREIGQKQDEQDKKWRERGVVPGDDQPPEN